MIEEKVRRAAALGLTVLLLTACAGCGRKPDPQEGPAQAVTESSSIGGEETAEEAETADVSGDTSGEAETSSAVAATTGETAVPAVSRTMTKEELSAMEAYLNLPENRGFLSSAYKEPGQIDLGTALEGLPGGRETPGADETGRYLEKAGLPELTGTLVKRTREEMEAFVLSRTGMLLAPETETGSWLYLEKEDAWYRMVPETEEPALPPVSVLEGTVTGTVWEVRFKALSPAGEADGYKDPLYETVLIGKLTEADLRFESCLDISEAPLFSVRTGAGERTAALSFFAPDDEIQGGTADVTIVYEAADGTRAVLEGKDPLNIRTDGARFQDLLALDLRDMDGDGLTDLVMILAYTKDGKDPLTELRIYKGASYGVPHIDRDLADSLAEAASSGRLEDVYGAAGGRTDPVPEGYKTWQEAYKAYVEARGDQDLLGYALADIDGNGVPELAAIGARPALGSRVLTFQGGRLISLCLGQQFFSYMENEGLLCDSYTAGATHTDTIYSMHSGRFEAASSGAYRISPAETFYSWDGAKMTREGYRDAREFIFSSERASRLRAEDLMDAAGAAKAIEEGWH